MAGSGFDYAQMKKLQQSLKELSKNESKFCEACAKELAARLLDKLIERTPVGDYSHEITVTAKRNGKKHKKGEQYTKKVKYGGKNGGTLRKGWITPKEGSGAEGLNTNNVSAFVDTLKINHLGDTYVIEIINSTDYASYVEYGHRTVNHRGWVPGVFMMTIAEREIKSAAPKILEAKIEKFLGGALK